MCVLRGITYKIVSLVKNENGTVHVQSLRLPGRCNQQTKKIIGTLYHSKRE
jgi:hypothetical protein